MKRGLFSTTMLTAPQRVMDPVSATIATVSAFAASSAVASFAVQVAASLVLTFVAQALAPKPKARRARSLSGTILTNSREPDAPQEYVYGQVRKGGVITFMEGTGTNNRYLHVVIVLAGHEVEEIGDIYINDEIATIDGSGFVTNSPWDGSIRIKKHTGAASQVADADLVAETSVTESFIGRGIAFIYARLRYDQNIFASGVPLFTAVVKGKKVYDPRDTSTAWTANAALCLRDYIAADYGLEDSAIDETVFQTAANVCDESVSLDGGGAESRYEINGVISSDAPVGDVLEQMTTACAGSLFWGQGNWQIKPGYYIPPVKTFTLDDLRGAISISTRINMRDNFSRVTGTFNDAAQDFITVDYPAIGSDVFLSEDGGTEAALDFELPLTTSAAAAQRLAKLALFRGREQITFSADFGLEAFGVQVGDVVALTMDRYGWSAKEFEVVGWRFFANEGGGDLRVNLMLRETSAAAFDWDAEEASIIANNTSLLSYTDTPTVGVSVASEAVVSNEKVSSRFSVTVTAGAAAQVDQVEVQFKKNSAVNYTTIGTGDLGVFEVADVEPGLYDFRARAINGFGFKGEWTALSGVVATEDTTPPSDVSGFAVEVNGPTTHLEWSPSTDADLSFYRIRHAVETTGATWAGATTAVEKVSRPATAISVPARPGTYMIRAYDKSGLASSGYASQVVIADELEGFATTDTQTENPTFAGAKTSCSVDGDNRLRITDSSVAPSSAEYDFGSVIDTGAARRARVRVDATVQRIDDSAGLWDDMPGKFDSLPGLFDDFTGAAQFADCDVESWVSTTPDDPTGSPTWSAYRKIRSAELYARAFRFRSALTSTSADVTPAISALTATVEY